MSHPPPQHIGNHARYVPLFHFVALPILLINFIYQVVMVYRGRTLDDLINCLVAIALIIVAFAARSFANTVQDRVIRVEEQIRFERLLPDDLRARIPEFTRDQFVGLRFASDSELPTLARAVLDQRITDRSAIKQMVQGWRPDHLRA